MLTRHEMTAANGPYFGARYPDTLAHPMTGALHRILDHSARTITSEARAGIQNPLTRQLTTFLHDRTRAVALLHFPAACADGDRLLNPHRLTSVIGAHFLPYFCHGAIASDRHLTDMLLVNRPTRAITLRNLIFLPDWLVHRVAALAYMLLVHGVVSAVILRHLIRLPTSLVSRVAALANMLLVHGVVSAVILRHLIRLPTSLVSRVAALANMLLVHGVVSAVILRHLIRLPTSLVSRVAALANMLFVNGSANSIFLHDVEMLINRLAHGVALGTDVLFINRPVADGTALFHDRAIDRTIANASPVLVDGLITDAVMNSGHAALFGAVTSNGVATGAAMRCLCWVCQCRRAERSQERQDDLLSHLWTPRHTVFSTGGFVPASSAGALPPLRMCPIKQSGQSVSPRKREKFG